MDGAVRAIRVRRGLTISQLARLARVSRQTVYLVESGGTIRNIETTLRLAEALRVRLDQIDPSLAARLRRVLALPREIDLPSVASEEQIG